jgi:hypothetical protein
MKLGNSSNFLTDNVQRANRYYVTVVRLTAGTNVDYWETHVGVVVAQAGMIVGGMRVCALVFGAVVIVAANCTKIASVYVLTVVNRRASVIICVTSARNVNSRMKIASVLVGIAANGGTIANVRVRMQTFTIRVVIRHSGSVAVIV